MGNAIPYFRKWQQGGGLGEGRPSPGPQDREGEGRGLTSNQICSWGLKSGGLGESVCEPPNPPRPTLTAYAPPLPYTPPRQTQPPLALAPHLRPPPPPRGLDHSGRRQAPGPGGGLCGASFPLAQQEPGGSPPPGPRPFDAPDFLQNLKDWGAAFLIRLRGTPRGGPPAPRGSRGHYALRMGVEEGFRDLRGGAGVGPASSADPGGPGGWLSLLSLARVCFWGGGLGGGCGPSLAAEPFHP